MLFVPVDSGEGMTVVRMLGVETQRRMTGKVQMIQHVNSKMSLDTSADNMRGRSLEDA